MDEVSQYMADWQTAQDHYRAGVNAGYSEQDAAQMYLDPVKDKWNILKTVPPALQPKASQELDAAHQSFLNGMQAGYKQDDSENIYLKPEQMKWSAVADLGKNQGDPYVADKISALTDVSSGQDPLVVAKNYNPKIFSDPKFEARYQEYAHTYQQGQQKQAEVGFQQQKLAQQKQDAAAAKVTSPDALQTQDEKLASAIAKAKASGDDGMESFYTGQKSQVDSALTNQPPVFNNGKFTFQPPPSQSDIIAQQHPGWTAAQVGLAQQGKLGGATDNTQKMFTDKTGQKFIYKGNSDDPAKDTNPDSWQVAQ